MALVSPLSLRTQLTLVALATLLPLAALVVLSDFEDRRDRREAAIESWAALAESAANNVEGFTNDLETLILAGALSMGSRADPITQANSGPFLARLSEQEPMLRSLFVTDLSGAVLAEPDGANVGLDLSSRPYVQALQAGAEETWSGALSGIVSGQATVVHGRVIRGPEGNSRGYILAAFYAQALLDRLPAGLPADASVVLIDQAGRVSFSSSDPTFARTERDARGSPLVSSALSGESVTLTSHLTPFDRGERYGAIVPIPTMNWAVALTRSRAELESSINAKLLRDLGVLALLGIGSILGLALVATRISQPLSRLVRAAGDIAEGNPAAIPRTPSDPDVAKLQEAFATMTLAVAEREERLRDQARVLSTLEQVGAWLASDLDFEKTVQAVTDAGTRLTEAEFGAFFYNIHGQTGDSFQLYTLSGVDPADFAGFPLPRGAEVFGPTFRGEGPIRIDDVTEDPHYGKVAPHFGMPEGHPPVRSYLAVSVVGRQGEVIGGLFFGHSLPARFSQRHEDLARGVAAWSAIALENARLYAQARGVQEELRRSNRSKDEFLALVSHELRTPTTTIYGGASLLQSRRATLDPATVEELTRDLAQESARLARLIENLLVFARLEIGQEVDRTAVSVPEVAQRVIANFRKSHPGRVVQLDGDSNLPNIFAEATYLEQTMENLLSNAAKYSDEGEPVLISVLREGSEVQFIVRDHGPGVHADEIGQIFDSFYRSQKTAQVAAGHGLGLTLCKRLIEAQGGRIWAQNRPGGGLEVGFAFPVLVTRPERLEPAPEAAPAG